MLEEYRRKMDHLQRQFDAQLRPKLDELKRQVVTVEERIREVSETRDLLLSEAITEHQVPPPPVSHRPPLLETPQHRGDLSSCPPPPRAAGCWTPEHLRASSI